MAGTWTSTGAPPGLARSARVTGQVLANESAPTSSLTDGVHLADVGSILPVFTAPSGQTFTGIGALLGYILPPGATAWVRAPAADQDLSYVAGLEIGAGRTIEILFSAGRLMLIPLGVTVSGAGTTMQTDYYCASKRGGGHL